MPHEIFSAGANQMFSDLLSCPVITPPCGTIGFNCTRTCGTNRRARSPATLTDRAGAKNQTPPTTAATRSHAGANYKPPLKKSASPGLIKSRAAAVCSIHLQSAACMGLSRHRHRPPESRLPRCAKAAEGGDAAGEPGSCDYW